MLDIVPGKLESVFSESFSRYGRVQADFRGGALRQALLKTPAPSDAVIYVASEPSLEATPEYCRVQAEFFGGLPCEGGYCNGSATRVDTLEYHRSSEWMLLGSDVVLLLGHRWEIQGDAYDFSKLSAFLVPSGTALELFATTLHYSPLNAKKNQPFQAVIVLPRGTNGSNAAGGSGKGESSLLAASNKWVLHSPRAVEIASLIP